MMTPNDGPHLAADGDPTNEIHARAPPSQETPPLHPAIPRMVQNDSPLRRAGSVATFPSVGAI
jgi:hypothetical protein